MLCKKSGKFKGASNLLYDPQSYNIVYILIFYKKKNKQTNKELPNL